MFRYTLVLVTLLMVYWTEAVVLRRPKSQAQLVKQLQLSRHIKSKVVQRVMSKVDRRFYVNHSYYDDRPVEIGFGATIDPPFMHAFVLETLKKFLTKKSSVLDIGSGSGYLTVCMSMIAGRSANIIGLDHVQTLTEHARQNVIKDKPVLIEKGKLSFMVRDARVCDLKGPFDVIYFGAAMREVPDKWLEQLKKGGRMLLPFIVSGNRQEMMIVDKLVNGTVTKVMKYGVMKKHCCESLLTITQQLVYADAFNRVANVYMYRSGNSVSFLNQNMSHRTTANRPPPKKEKASGSDDGSGIDIDGGSASLSSLL